MIGSGFLPEVGPDTGYNNLTLLLGLAACVAVVWREFQARKTRREMDADAAPMWISVLRLAVMVGVIVFASLRFASGRVGTSFPVSGIILVAWSWPTPSTPATPPAAGTSTRSAATPGPRSSPA